jgi:DNA polymerase III delta prime subunit
MQHHAFVIEAEAEKGIEQAQVWVREELGMKAEKNPDIVVQRYGLFSVDDARYVCDMAIQAPFVGVNKVLIITASRAYHEAQNALLKLFEEPPEGTYLFLILPSVGGLLPTLRSRVQELMQGAASRSSSQEISKAAQEFLKANKEKRSAFIKRLANGRDEEERRKLRDEAITIINGIEAFLHKDFKKNVAILSDISILRGHLYDRSAPVRMILEHLSLITPKGLPADRKV